MCSTKPWFEALPVVPLGLRTSFKEDLQAIPAEMLYGTTLRIPGDFFVSSDQPADPQIYVDRHRELMRALRPIATAHHNKARPFILKDINTCTHVFLRNDAVKRPLEPPYDGTLKVVETNSDRVYSILINGVKKTVSIERLKPAYFNKEDHENERTNQHEETLQSTIDPPKRTYKKVQVKLPGGVLVVELKSNTVDIAMTRNATIIKVTT
ncbi:uncharacterized protein [Prorops nasuta]|uniref:uncharacterized protein n=1 Tax=Prorops nasuta TaxID=863751 RepID=UPI0034CDA933